MQDALERDYNAMAGMIMGPVPPFADVMDAVIAALERAAQRGRLTRCRLTRPRPWQSTNAARIPCFSQRYRGPRSISPRHKSKNSRFDICAASAVRSSSEDRRPRNLLPGR